MKIEHPWVALLIVFGVAFLLNTFGIDGTTKLIFLVAASFFIYKFITARRR